MGKLNEEGQKEVGKKAERKRKRKREKKVIKSEIVNMEERKEWEKEEKIRRTSP